MSDNGLPHLAERLNFLFAHRPRADGKPMSNRQAAAALGDLGVSSTSAYISHLRTGMSDNPSVVVLNGLASLFSIPITYFLDGAVARTIQVELAATNTPAGRLPGVTPAVSVTENNAARSLDAPHLAGRLDALFTHIPDETGHLYDDDSAATALTASGIATTAGRLRHLRSGDTTASTELLAALARLFGVSVEYFLDGPTAATVTEQLPMLAALRDARIARLATDMVGLSDAGVANLSALIQRLRQLEGLDDKPHTTRA